MQAARLYRSGHSQYNRDYRLRYGHKQSNNVILDTEQDYTQNGFHNRNREVGVTGSVRYDTPRYGTQLSRAEEHKQEQIVENGTQKRGYHKLTKNEQMEAVQEQKDDIEIRADDMGRGGNSVGNNQNMFSGASHTSRGGHYTYGHASKIALRESKKTNPKRLNDGDDQIAEEKYGDKEITTKDEEGNDMINKIRMGKLDERPQPNEEMQKSFWL